MSVGLWETVGVSVSPFLLFYMSLAAFCMRANLCSPLAWPDPLRSPAYCLHPHYLKSDFFPVLYSKVRAHSQGSQTQWLIE